MTVVKFSRLDDKRLVVFSRSQQQSDKNSLITRVRMNTLQFDSCLCFAVGSF